MSDPSRQLAVTIQATPAADLDVDDLHDAVTNALSGLKVRVEVAASTDTTWCELNVVNVDRMLD